MNKKTIIENLWMSANHGTELACIEAAFEAGMAYERGGSANTETRRQMESAEQQARDMLERMGVANAQAFTAGDLVELANLIADKQVVEREEAHTCKKCGGTMRPGKAIEQTLGGLPDMGVVMTMHPSGPGKLVDCLKCGACGWSVTTG